MADGMLAMLTSLLVYFPFLAIALIAQWSDRDRVVRWVAYGLFLLFDASAAMVGVLASLIGWSSRMKHLLASQYAGIASLHLDVFGLIVIGVTLLAPVFLLPFVRRGLARIIPIDPDSGVHATALALAVLAAGLNLSQVPLVGGLSVLAESAASITFLDLLASNLPIGLFAFVGVGFLIRRTPRETQERLGLERITWPQAGLTVVLASVILVFYYGVDWAWRLLGSDSYEMMESLGEVLYGGVMVTWQAVVVSLVAGVTEELFFRGALQPRFGFWLTAFLFTAVHVQYGLTPATVEVLGGALVLGWLRRRTNTSACILLHVLYDLAGLLVFPLLP